MVTLLSLLMSLELKHKQLAVYKIASNLVSECYRLTMKLPAEERFCLVQQIRRAAVSVILNIAEGSSRKFELERKRFFELSRGSLTEVDTALDLCVLIGHLKKEDVEVVEPKMIECFKILSKLVRYIDRLPSHYSLLTTH